MFNAEFWVAVAFVIFVFGIQKRVRQMVGAALDEQSARIRGEIDEAQKLREEAQALLAQYQRQQEEAVAEAKAIVNQAREEADRQLRVAAEALEESMHRREQQVRDRIARIEEMAIDEVRAATVSLALGAAEKVIISHLTPKRADNIVDAAIADLENKPH